MKTITIEVTGDPVAKGRPRVAVIKGRARMYTPAATRSWENDARQLARIEMGGDAPLEGPLKVTVDAVFAPPESWPAWRRKLLAEGEAVWCASAKDIDNICKAICDAMNRVVWLDDKQIVDLRASKTFGLRPMVRATVQPLTGWHGASKRGDVP